MAKPKLEVSIESYGMYTPLESAKDIPSITKFADKITVSKDVEFGYVLRIKKGKGKKITFRIDHPPFKDDTGNTAKPFTGEQYIRSNDYRFFLGDTFWEPYSDKVGRWTLTTWVEGEHVAEKTLTMIKETV